MIIRIKGAPVSANDLANAIQSSLALYTGDMMVSGATLYVNFYNKEGKMVDLVDENGNSKEITIIAKDPLQDMILEKLKNGVKNKDIAQELGINSSRVTRIKKRLINEGLYKEPKKSNRNKRK